MQLRNPNSVLAFVFSIGSISAVLDYLLWPRVIKASESLEQGIQVNLIAGIAFLILSGYFLTKSRKSESPNVWQKISMILSLIISLVFVGSGLFYLYIEMSK